MTTEPRYVTIASICMGVHAGSVAAEAKPILQSSSRSSAYLSSPSFYHTAQPIHPVLQRRNTPLNIAHQRRRVTQPVPISFSPLDFPCSENENLTCDKTGKMPIPPPRTPRQKSTITRNVSHNGLRSPKLSPKPRRANVGQSQNPITTNNSSRNNSFNSTKDSQRPESNENNSTRNSENNEDIGLRMQNNPHRPENIESTPSKIYQIPPSEKPRREKEIGVYNHNLPRRAKFHIDIPPVKDSPPPLPKANRTNAAARIRKVLAAPPTYVNYEEVQLVPKLCQPRQSFDEIVDEIFKTIGTEQSPKSTSPHPDYAQPDVKKPSVHFRDREPSTKDYVYAWNQPRLRHKEEYVSVVDDKHDEELMEDRTKDLKVSAAVYSHISPTGNSNKAVGLPRSKSDVGRDKLRAKRRLSSLMPSALTVPENLYLQQRAKEPPINLEWMEESTEVRYSPSNHDEFNPANNVMQRMRKTLTNLRSGVLARMQKAPNYTRKSSCPVDFNEEVYPPENCVFYDVVKDEGLLKPVDSSKNLCRPRKPTSADSGIVDLGLREDGDDASDSLRHGRPTSSDYSSNSPMRRSRSQPPVRLVSFAELVVPATTNTDRDDKSSDLDRSVSARSSRTSELSSGSSSPPVQEGKKGASQEQQVATNPLYIESLWSQVKYEVDCEQHITECSLEGMRANVVREIVKNERDFVSNLKDVIEGYLYKCRQRPDMFSKGRIECIFGNIEQLYEFQCEFLADLEASINVNNVHRSEIGHCFLLHQRGFSELYSDYCNNHTQSTAELQQLKQIRQYAHFFEACRMLQEMVEISLDGFLLQPVQKICKYPLQLTELLKQTSDDHPDCQSVKLALSAMKNVTGMINERKRRLECLEKIALWQETIDLWEGDDLVEQSSQLIHYGDLSKLSNKNSWTHDYTFFLFDHQLIYCRRDMLKRTLAYKGRFDLDLVEVLDIEQNDAGVKHGWLLVCPDKEHSTMVLAKSFDEKQRWLEAFKDERRRVHNDMAHGFNIAAKDRLTAIQIAKTLTAGKEKRSKTKDALKDLTDHTQLVQTMRSKSLSMTLPVRIKANQASRNPFSGRLPSFGGPKKL